MFHIVVGIDQNRGIGNAGTLPWPKLKGDMKFYRELTTCPISERIEQRYKLVGGDWHTTFSSYDELVNHLRDCSKLPAINDLRPNAVIMGRKTWDSLPEKFRPLPNRLNVIVTHRRPLEESKNVLYVTNFDEALERLIPGEIANIFVIGGRQLYNEALAHLDCDKIYLTKIKSTFTCDTHFPRFSDIFTQKSCGLSVIENGLHYQFNIFERNSQ
jgi:dihydrofolate reductase